MDFDLDSESERTNDEDEAFSWRMDPEESVSDWKISIVDETGEHSAVYHVHKNYLSAGARKSQYFVPLMKGETDFTESFESSSKINLLGLAARAFPDMLDYIYTGEVHCTTENSTALHYLGSYFGVKKLRWHVKKFLKQDIRASNSDIYFIHSTLFQDEKILSAVMGACVSDLMAIDTSSQLLQVTSAGFWLNVLERAPQTVGFREHLSKLISEYCRHHPDMELSTFKVLSSRENLPQMHLSAALCFCQQTNFAMLEDGEDSDLQSRCLECIAEKWKEINWSDIDMTITMSKMNKDLVARLLVLVATSSQSHSLSLSDELDDAISDRNRSRREKKSAQKAIKGLKREISSLTKSKVVLNEALQKATNSSNAARGADASSDDPAMFITLEHPQRDRRRPIERRLSSSSLSSQKSWAHELRTSNSSADISEIRNSIGFRCNQPK